MPQTCILLVEDEALVARSIQRRLTGMGYRVARIFSAGEDALAYLAEHRADLVLIDIRLAGEIDGVELGETVHNRYDIPVVYLTAYADEDILARAKTSQPFGYLLKPFESSQLRTTIEMALYQYEIERRLKESEARYRVVSEELRDLAGYLQTAREEERTLIAREIHDELGQALTALKMDVAWLLRHLAGPEAARTDKLHAMSDLIDETIQSVRRVATALRPGLLDDLGLAPAVEWQVQEFMERTGIDASLWLSDDDLALDRDRATAVFRIFQELLTNVARHANASHLRVSLEDSGEAIILTVQDDGRGIDGHVADSSKSLGLLGIRERARSLDGDVSIASQPGQGTTVTVRIPRAGVEKGVP